MGQLVGVNGRDSGYGKVGVVNHLQERFRPDDILGTDRFLTLDAGEVVEVAPDVVATAFVEVDFISCPHDQIVEIACRDLGLGQLHWPLHDGLPFEGEAMGLDGAVEAVGALWGAVQGAELHHGLVV